MELNELEKIRVEKINAMRAAGVEPYPTRSEVNISIQQAVDDFTQFENSHPDESFSDHFILGGRIRSIRTMGKLAFAHIEDGSGRIQLMLRLNELGQESLDQFKSWFDLGDFIQAEGSLMRSRTGEVTLLVSAFKMLAKAVSPLPAAKDEEVDGQIIRHATLSDPETRFRERYADLAINEDVREIFRTRTAVVRSLQRFMDESWFPGSGNPHFAAHLRRRGRAAFYHASQPAKTGIIPAHLLRAVPETAAGRRPGPRVRDWPRFPQRRCILQTQSRIHTVGVLLGLRGLPQGDGIHRADGFHRRPGCAGYHESAVQGPGN